jgi:hypothetical protein
VPSPRGWFLESGGTGKAQAQHWGNCEREVENKDAVGLDGWSRTACRSGIPSRPFLPLFLLH